MSLSKNLKQLSKDTILYGLGTAIQMFIGFFLFPIYARVLSQADFGAQDLVTTSIAIFSYFMILGLESGASRHYYGAGDDEKRTILSSWLWFEIIISISGSVTLILFAAPICAGIFNDITLVPFFQLGMVSLPLTIIASVFTMALRLTFQSKRFMILVVLSVFIQTVAAILFVVVLDLGISGVFLALIVSASFRVIVGFLFTYPQFGFSFSWRWLRLMLAFGIPLVPASLSIWILNYSNRYFLVRFSTLEDIGLLSVGTKISSVVTFFIHAFQIGWGPFAYSLIGDESNAKATFSSVLTYFLLVSITITVGITTFSREIINILTTPAYQPSVVVIPWLAFSAIAWGTVYIVGMGYNIAKKSFHTTIATLLGASINTGLNFLLIPLWGIFGAAISTLAGNITALLYSYKAGQYYFEINYDFRRIITLFCLAIIAIGGSLLFNAAYPEWNIESLLLRGTLFSLFVCSLFFFRVIKDEEIRYMRGLILIKFASQSQ